MPNRVACVCMGRYIRAPECFFGHEVLKSEGIKSDKINTQSNIVSLNFFVSLKLRKEISNPRSLDEHPGHQDRFTVPVFPSLSSRKRLVIPKPQTDIGRKSI